MTDKEALLEIERQEKRFAAEKCGRGAMLAKSARDYYKQMQDAGKKYAAIAAKHMSAKASLAELESAVKAAEGVAKAKMAEAQKLRAKMAGFRVAVKSGDRLRTKENVARQRLAEKLKALKAMSVA